MPPLSAMDNKSKCGNDKCACVTYPQFHQIRDGQTVKIMSDPKNGKAYEARRVGHVLVWLNK